MLNPINNDLIYSSDAFQAFFKNSTRSLLLKANPPYFTVLAVSEAYLTVLQKERSEVLEHSLFEAIADSAAFGAQTDAIYASFMRVMDRKAIDVPAAIVYEKAIDGTTRTEIQHLSAVNEPLTDEDGNVAYLINTTTNITGHVKRQQLAVKAILDKQGFDREHVLYEALTVTNEALNTAGLILNETNERLEERIEKRNRVFADSKTRFRAIVEQAPVAIATYMGPKFIVELCNARVLEYWGRTEADVKGLPVFAALPEVSGQGLEEILTNVLTTGEPFSANEQPVTILRDGQLAATWVNFIYAPLRDENGDISGILSVCNEVTNQVNERKTLERIIEEKTSLENTLRDSKQRLQGILDTMAEGVSIVDTKRNVVYANAMAQTILGLTESVIKDRTYDDAKWQNIRLDGSPLPEEEHPIFVVMKTKQIINDYEYGIKPPGKDVIFISLNAAPIIDGDGKITGGIGTFMDVTHRRRLMEQKDEFISVASHELKTPLTALKTSIQLLNGFKNGTSSPVMHSLIAQADTSVNRLHVLVNNLLDVDRISRGEIVLRRTKFGIGDLINDYCEHLLTAGTHKILLGGNVDTVVFADESRIRQVIINLVNNAVHYAPQSRRIIINVEEREKDVKVSVTDFGAGIAKEKMPNLFDRYYRAAYTIGQGGGLGLGLYISSEIIKNHGGEIGAESEEGKGSTFWFTLPAA